MRTVIKENVNNIAVLDVMSALAEHRTIFIDGEINDESSSDIISQMLYLDSVGKEEITVYIKSPGGGVHDGLAIYDTSKIIKSPIKTVGMGCVASMGCILMFMAPLERRFSLKHTRFMLHEIAGGVIDKYTPMKIVIDESKKLQDDLYDIIKENTTLTDIENLLRFDTWFSVEEAKHYKIVNKIL